MPKPFKGWCPGCCVGPYQFVPCMELSGGLPVCPNCKAPVNFWEPGIVSGVAVSSLPKTGGREARYHDSKGNPIWSGGVSPFKDV